MKNPDRRTALKNACATCVALAIPSDLFAKFESPSKPTRTIQLGVIADLHGGLAVDAETRLDVFLESMADKGLDALIQLGDFAFPNQAHQSYADKFNAANEKTIHVIGNHEFDFELSRDECFKAWGINTAYYRYDLPGVRVLVLDGNESGSPDFTGGYPSYIGKEQQDWLSNELAVTDRPVLILSHQPLAGTSAIDNAVQVQNLLAKHKDKIILCLNGHSHVDSLLQVKGVSYLHVNSASYYWVGGDKRMAYYKDPVFTTISIEPDESRVVIEGSTSMWKENDNPGAINYFDRDDAPPETIVVPAIRERRITDLQIETVPNVAAEASTIDLKVMTWNIWGRLNQDPRYTIGGKTARQRTVEIIQESGADIIAMIETYGSAADIADALDFHYHTPAADANLCIFSRYPLSNVQLLDGLSSFSFIAATATLPNNRQIRVYDVWLTSGGRHIVEIKNKDLSDQEFCDGDDNRFEMLAAFLQHDDVRNHLANAANIPVIAAGDFNCVSHLDHTAGTRHSNLNQSRILPVKVSRAMHKAGFSDSYRETNPDIHDSTLGHTWTTVGLGYVYKSDEGFVPVDENPEPQYRDPYARIDYIYSVGSILKPKSSKVIAHHPSESGRSFPEFPSDHAAVLTEFTIE